MLEIQYLYTNSCVYEHQDQDASRHLDEAKRGHTNLVAYEDH